VKYLLAAALAAAFVMTTAALTSTPSSEGRLVSERPLGADRSAGLAVRTAKCRRETSSLRRGIVDRRAATWRHQAAAGARRTPTEFREREAIGCSYLRWLRQRWAGRAIYAYRIVVTLRDPDFAIEYVFGSYASQAKRVAACESGDTDGDLSPSVVYASNGQYQGMFQMGSSERSIYGHGSTPVEQARAAYAYFVDSGRDWSPWACKP